MPAALERKLPSVVLQTRGGDGEKESGCAYLLQHKTVQLPEQVREVRTALEQRHGFRVNAIGHQRRADAVAGDVANQQIQPAIFERRYRSKVTTNRPRRHVIRLHRHPAPEQPLWRHALLYARGQRQLYLNFTRPLLQLLVGAPQVCFRLLLLADVGKCQHGENAAVRIFDFAGADDHGNADLAALSRNEMLEAIAPFGPPARALLLDSRQICSLVETRRSPALQRRARHCDELFHALVGKQNPLAVVDDQHALVEGFEDALHLLEPRWFFDLQELTPIYGEASGSAHCTSGRGRARPPRMLYDNSALPRFSQ